MVVRQRGSAAFLALFCVLVVGSCNQETFQLLPSKPENNGGGGGATAGGRGGSSGRDGSDRGGKWPGGGEAPVGGVDGSGDDDEGGRGGEAGAPHAGEGQGGGDGFGGFGGFAGGAPGGGGGVLGRPPELTDCQLVRLGACSGPGDNCERSCGKPGDELCPPDKRFCDDCGFCKECDSNDVQDCDDDSEVCALLTKRCVSSCRTDRDCPPGPRGAPMYCGNGRYCVACEMDEHCENNNFEGFNVCSEDRCVQCTADNHCDNGDRCENLKCVDR